MRVEASFLSHELLRGARDWGTAKATTWLTGEKKATAHQHLSGRKERDKRSINFLDRNRVAEVREEGHPVKTQGEKELRRGRKKCALGKKEKKKKKKEQKRVRTKRDVQREGTGRDRKGSAL